MYYFCEFIIHKHDQEETLKHFFQNNKDKLYETV